MNCSSPAAYTPKHLADKILTSGIALEGERKQVTVLFCDIVESSRLAERLDPEAMHEIWVWRHRRRLQFSRHSRLFESCLRFVQPVRHAHLTVHRRRRGEVLLRLSALLRAPVERAET